MRDPFYKRQPYNLVIIRMSALGDILHTLPAYQAIRNGYKRTHIYWLADKPFAEFLSRVDGIKDVLAFDRPDVTKKLGTLTRFWQAVAMIWAMVVKLRDLRLVGAIVFQPLLRASLFGRSSGARVRLGYSRLAEGGYFCLNKRTSVSKNQHAIIQNLDLLKNMPVDRTPNRVKITLTEDDHAPVKAFFKDHDLAPGNIVVLSPEASKKEKVWTAEGYAALLDRISREQMLVPVIVWGPGERELAEAIHDKMKTPGIIAPDLSITQLAAMLKQASYVVAPDTGPLHLAATLGTPVVGLYGPSDPLQFGPYWEPNRIVVAHNPKSPKTTPKDMEHLSGDAVFEACQSLYGNIKRAA